MAIKREKKYRAAGILLPVSSLPSRYGIGGFGRAAYDWIDFLREAEQSYWQVLPLNPTSYGDSPYQSFSAFAGNPYFIDLDLLCGDGLLTPAECAAADYGGNDLKVDYGAIWTSRESLLRKAFSRFEDKPALREFRLEHEDWLEDYALYMAIKAKNALRPWHEWDEELRLRNPAALKRCQKALKNDVDYHIFTQLMFFKQWDALKAYANESGVRIIGDIPIYVAMDSADAWAGSELFQLDKDGLPTEVAGCPPDAFSDDGQLWGNPLYRWDVMEKDGYAWWMRRLRACLSMYDTLRIDHFRGLESYYAIPYGSKTAVLGQWKKGPGMSLINAIRENLPGADIIAEDLGFLTPEVKRLLRQSGYPGMKVLQFAFDSREESDYMPHNYRRNCVVYTGTHDNDTTRGWLKSASRCDTSVAKAYLGIPTARGGCMAMIRAALMSIANLAVIPMQDYLNLGSEARINTPSTLGGDNWRWRMDENAASPKLAADIARMMKLYGRSPYKRRKRR